MRYFAHLAYNGVEYNGWQIQPNSKTIQGEIQTALLTLLRQEISVVGCGRTDTGVHARNYYLHFDYDGEFPDNFLRRLNFILPKEIVIYDIVPTAPNAHARFDAYLRTYEYHIVFNKNPFELQTAWQYPYNADHIDIEKLQQAAAILLDYKEFAPFCRTHSDANTMFCELTRSEWVYHEAEGRLVFYITSNRFLRGMVRLIVGMCVRVANGKIELDEVRDAMDNQTILRLNYSVPPQGLFLTEVKYPFEVPPLKKS